MDTASYLARINYSGPTVPVYDVLAALQRSHLMSVPFENLDIQDHIPIDLTRTFDKIVTRHRGGFCYELNGLFYQLLKTIGFKAKMISARVYDNNRGFGPEFDHLAIIVTLDTGEYLVDVGFGEFALQPLQIIPGKEQQDPTGIFRIVKHDELNYVVEKKKPDGLFMPEYLFSGTERGLGDFSEMCRYHQTSSDSHFTQKRICSLPTAEGRITLSGNILKITQQGTVSEKLLADGEEVQQVLETIFKIKRR